MTTLVVLWIYKEWCLSIGLGIFYLIEIFKFFKKLRSEKEDWIRNEKLEKIKIQPRNKNKKEPILVEYKTIS